MSAVPKIKQIPLIHEFFEIRLNSIAADFPLAFDVYLVVNSRPTLFRRRGDTITTQRLKLLQHHGGEKFLVPEDQREFYLQNIKNFIYNPDSKTDVKSQFIKESAFLHVHALFTKPDITDTITEARGLIEEMVKFVTEDVNAVASLMRLSVHDYYTYNHCVNVAVYAIALAKRTQGADKEQLITAGLGGLLHDIGKRKIAHSLINKKSALDRAEWEEIKRHPTYGRSFLEELTTLPDETKLIVYEHHENFDGTGYPNGLKDDGICSLAKVVTIADVFDALTTDRSYHKAMIAKDALNTMFGMQPGKFDPDVFKSFNKNFEKKPDHSLPPNFDPCSLNAPRDVQAAMNVLRYKRK